MSLLGMPGSWKRFQESGFPIDDYDKEIPLGEYEVVLNGSCYSRSRKRGTGVHLFARHVESEKKYWFYVHYLPGHPSYLGAKEACVGQSLRLLVEVGRNGRGLVKNVICPAMVHG